MPVSKGHATQLNNGHHSLVLLVFCSVFPRTTQKFEAGLGTKKGIVAELDQIVPPTPGEDGVRIV